MNHRRGSIQLPVAAPSSERNRTPADSDRRPHHSPHGCGASAPTRKARSGPGRRQVHSPTTSLPGPSPHPTDLSGRRCPPRRTRVPRCWGETSPLSPQAPLYPLSVPMGRRRNLVAETPGVATQNGALSCAKTDCQKPAHRAKTSRTRSPAPFTEHTHETNDYAASDGRTLSLSSTVVILSTDRRPHPFTCWR